MNSKAAMFCNAQSHSPTANFPCIGENGYAFRDLAARGLLDDLLKDRTTGKNILWATETCAELGFGGNDEMEARLLAGRQDEIVSMRLAKLSERTRKHGEVFTPPRICRRMCAYAHKALRGPDWQKYVLARVLEICCGEAPFLAARRYGGAGRAISPRVGLLDRKLEAINENVFEREEWAAWAFRAFQSAYGYEFQGYNLLMARINMLKTFEYYLRERWACRPGTEEYEKLLEIITWNFWQMDGLTGKLPGIVKSPASNGGKRDEDATPPCLIRDWQTGEIVTFLSLSAK